MARKTLITCDVCGASDALECCFYVDRRMDGAGSMDDEIDAVDLCAKHQWAAYKLAEQFLSFEQRRRVLASLREKRTKV